MFFVENIHQPLTQEEAGLYAEPLEMLRLAPSSGNTQPWRIVKEQNKNVFHFYKKPVRIKYEIRGLHDLDLGICLAHFELTAIQSQLNGVWKRQESQQPILENELVYMISWIGA